MVTLAVTLPSGPSLSTMKPHQTPPLLLEPLLPPLLPPPPPTEFSLMPLSHYQGNTAHQAILSSEHEEYGQEGHNRHDLCTQCSHHRYHRRFHPIPLLDSLQLPIFIDTLQFFHVHQHQKTLKKNTNDDKVTF